MEKAPKILDIETNQTEESLSTAKKKPYTAPKLHLYGGLADLVKTQPNRGTDGSTVFVDCTRT